MQEEALSWESCFHSGRCDLIILLAVPFPSLLCPSQSHCAFIRMTDPARHFFFLHPSSTADQMEAGDCPTRPYFRSVPRLQGICIGFCETRNQNASLPPWMPWKQERVLKDPKGGRGNADGSHLLRSAHNGTLPLAPIAFSSITAFRHSLNTRWGWMLPLWAHEGGFKSSCGNMISIYLD